MSRLKQQQPPATRRDFLKTTTAVLDGAALAGLVVPAVHAAEDQTLRVALVGCGGRGRAGRHRRPSTPIDVSTR
ncbi:MAG: twin-arginine translocation signal domain-containing protein [Pirellulales bacterium]